MTTSQRLTQATIAYQALTEAVRTHPLPELLEDRDKSRREMETAWLEHTARDEG